MLLLYGVIISWESRDIQREYNQSIALSLSIGTILLLGAILIPFDFTVFQENKTGIVWFRMAGIYIYMFIIVYYVNSDFNRSYYRNCYIICSKVL